MKRTVNAFTRRDPAAMTWAILGVLATVAGCTGGGDSRDPQGVDRASAQGLRSSLLVGSGEEALEPRFLGSTGEVDEVALDKSSTKKPTRSPTKVIKPAPRLPSQGQPCAADGRCATGLNCTADTRTCEIAGQPCTTGRRGQCSAGTYVLDGQQLTCRGSDPVPEVCGNALDENCDGLLNDGCPEIVLVEDYKIHCGSGGRGTHLIGRECPSGYTQGTCTVQGPQEGGLRGWTEWERAPTAFDDKNCRCKASCASPTFKGGDFYFRVTAAPCQHRNSGACRAIHSHVP